MCNPNRPAEEAKVAAWKKNRRAARRQMLFSDVGSFQFFVWEHYTCIGIPFPDESYEVYFLHKRDNSGPVPLAEFVLLDRDFDESEVVYSSDLANRLPVGTKGILSKEGSEVVFVVGPEGYIGPPSAEE